GVSETRPWRGGRRPGSRRRDPSHPSRRWLVDLGDVGQFLTRGERTSQGEVDLFGRNERVASHEPRSLLDDSIKTGRESPACRAPPSKKTGFEKNLWPGRRPLTLTIRLGARKFA